MDGTGELFKPLLNQLPDYSCQVISLPQSGVQDYLTLTEYVSSQLPKQEFIIIAESFSGPIAARLAQLKIQNLKAIIFVATFLSSPNKNLLSVARRLPIKLLIKFPLADLFIKKLFLGNKADPSLLNKFKTIVNHVPTEVLKQRMNTMQELKPQTFTSSIPTLYIQADKDRLVSNSRGLEFQKCFESLEFHQVNGPHFILQSQPQECAKAMVIFLNQHKTK